MNSPSKAHSDSPRPSDRTGLQPSSAQSRAAPSSRPPCLDHFLIACRVAAHAIPHTAAEPHSSPTASFPGRPPPAGPVPAAMYFRLPSVTSSLQPMPRQRWPGAAGPYDRHPLPAADLWQQLGPDYAPNTCHSNRPAWPTVTSGATARNVRQWRPHGRECGCAHGLPTSREVSARNRTRRRLHPRQRLRQSVRFPLGGGPSPLRPPAPRSSATNAAPHRCSRGWARGNGSRASCGRRFRGRKHA